MSKRKSLDVKKKILQILHDGNPYTYAELERKVNTAWESIIANCKELEIFGAVKIQKSKTRMPKNILLQDRKLLFIVYGLVSKVILFSILKGKCQKSSV